MQENQIIKPKSSFCELGKTVIKIEAQIINSLYQRIDDNFKKACELILACEGRVVVTGMGKSGHIANKIAATLASTGTPAFYMHPGEASHGDIGMITKKDILLALSNSGNTPEILTILPHIKRMGIHFIAMTGKPSSIIAQSAAVNLDVSVSQEACPLGLAPTSSTTAALVMGDALAVALLETRGFTEEDFALSHPGGALGRRLLLRVENIMRKGEAIPKVHYKTILNKVLVEVSQKRMGMTTVVDDNEILLGVFTDGDLRRVIDLEQDIRTISIDQCMTKNCKTIAADTLAIDALTIMETHKITTLVVATPHKHIVGVVHLHDLLDAGMV